MLCPKRMNDAQFWQVYFTLAKKYLPSEAFDRDLPAEGPTPSAAQNLDLQTSLKRTFEAARETARDWQSRASGTLRPAGSCLCCTPKPIYPWGFGLWPFV